MVETLVTCPNRCFNGFVKVYDNNEAALFNLNKCPYCNGNGEVLISRAKKIEEIL